MFFSPTPLLTFIVCCLAFVSTSPADERQALEELFNSTGGYHWYHNCRCSASNICWLQSNTSYCEWPNVDCRSTTNVHILSLSSCNLTGQLPDNFFAKLPKLGDLEMSNNSLTGPIPPLGMRHVYMLLDFNSLSGPFPIFTNITPSLNTLDLRFNQLEGPLPRGLSSIAPNLEYLLVSNNRFNGTIPSDLGKNLKELDLCWNRLTGPFPLLECRSLLIRLGLSTNMLTGNLNSSISEYKNLEVLLLSNNSFNGTVPEELGQISKLTNLDLSFNQVQGSIDSFLTIISKTWHISSCDVSSNNFTGSIKNLADPTSSTALSYLSVANNSYMYDTSDPFPELVLGAYDQSNGSFTCYSFRVITSPLVLVLSPSYFQYRFCNCSTGFFGKAPNCTNCQLIINAKGCEGMILKYNKNYWPVSTNPFDVPRFLPCSQRGKDIPCNPEGTCEIIYGIVGPQNCKFCSKGYTDRLCSKCLCDSTDCYFRHGYDCSHCQILPNWVIGLALGLMTVLLLLFFLAKKATLLMMMLAVVTILLLFGVSLWWQINVVLVFALVQLLTLWTNRRSDKQLSGRGENNEETVNIGGVAKILLFFVQTIQLVNPNVWPSEFIHISDTLQFINVNVDLRCYSSLRSLFDTEMKSYLIGMAVPPLLGIVYVILVLSRYCIQIIMKQTVYKWWKRHKLATKQLKPKILIDSENDPKMIISENTSWLSQIRHQWHILLHGILLLLYIAYPDLTKRTLAVFSCTKTEYENVPYISSMPWLECTTSLNEYYDLYISAIVGVIIYVAGIPLFFGFLLWANRNNSEKTKAWLGFLYIGYKEQYWWYEMMWMTRKFLISAFLALLSEQTKTFAISLVLLLSLICHFRVLPFYTSLENWLEVISLGTLLMTTSTANHLLTAGNKSGDNLVLTWILTCMIITSGAVIFICLFIRPFMFVWRSLSSRYRKRNRENILNRSSNNSDSFSE